MKKIEWKSTFSYLGITLTFLGTETQYELFQNKYMENDKKVFSIEKTIKLAKELGISFTIKASPKKEYNVGEVYHFDNVELHNKKMFYASDADVLILGKYRDKGGWRYAVAKPPLSNDYNGITEVQWMYLD